MSQEISCLTLLKCRVCDASKYQLFSFFAACAICKNNFSFSMAVFCYLSVQNCQLFSFKINWRQWDQKKLHENRDAPFFIHNSYIYQKFSEAQNGSPTEFFGTVRLKVFDRKSWNPPIMHKIFWYPKFSETLKGSRGKFFSPGRQKLFGKTVMISRSVMFPLLCMEISDTRSFLKHKRVPLRIFSALWDKKISTESSDIPFLCIKFFDTRNFLKHRSVLQRNFLVLRQKISNEILHKI